MTKQENETKKENYDFLEKDSPKNNSDGDETLNKFDEAFKKSSQEVQSYIISEEFPNNIAIICQLQKLTGSKENVIIENVAISILVGLLSTQEAKKFLMESFKVSGILLEELSAQMILKDIDAYILSHIRKEILKSKISNPNIRHLTLKEETEEKTKDELRKILLEKTGNVNGGGNIFQYKTQEIQSHPNPSQREGHTRISPLPLGGVRGEAAEGVSDRESLLAKINLNPGELSDASKLKDRIKLIKNKEEERLKRFATEKEKEIQTRLARANLQKQLITETEEKKKQENLESTEISDEIKKRLEINLQQKEYEKVNMSELIKEREEEERLKENWTQKKVADLEEARKAGEDAYRENI